MANKTVVSLSQPTPLWLRKIVRVLAWISGAWAFALYLGVDLKDFGVTHEVEFLVLKYMAILTGFVSAASRFVGVKPISFAFAGDAAADKSDEITGYYVDIPAGATNLDSVNGVPINVALADYSADVTYLPEVSTHYGLLEWGAEPDIMEVIIDGQNVPVQPVLNGSHPAQKPK